MDCGAGDLKVRESALQALGCLGIARPATLLAAEAQAIMKAALHPSAPTILKTRALNNLTELLKVPLLLLSRILALSLLCRSPSSTCIVLITVSKFLCLREAMGVWSAFTNLY